MRYARERIAQTLLGGVKLLFLGEALPAFTNLKNFYLIFLNVLMTVVTIHAQVTSLQEGEGFESIDKIF